MILATAGHVDHGKTRLVAALTGVDTDRLPEEKARGLSIDLGFAYTDLPDGRRIGFVDLPGHERFLGNLIAGLAVVDAILLVVAADSGPQAQSHAQLAILALLDLPPALAVLSKVDRVDAARRAAAEGEVDAALRQAGLVPVPVLPFSAVTGEGRDALLSRLQVLGGTVRPRPGAGFRLSVDRAFLRPGSGPVVTGGVAAGRLAGGATAMLSPAGVEVRVREIRAMDRPAAAALAGQRCALGLAGRELERVGLGRAGGIGRGQWLVDAVLHRPTMRLDVLLRPQGELRHGRQVALHIGAARLQARLALHDLPPLAGGIAAHLRLDRPVAALAGDRLLLREPAGGDTLAGGRVLDPWPPDRGMMRPARAALIAALAETGPVAQAAALLAASPDGVDLMEHALAGNADPAAAGAAFAAAGGIAVAGRAIGAAQWQALQQALETGTAAAHEAAPEAAAIGRAELARSAARGRPAALVAAGLDSLVADGRLLARGEAVALPGHQPRLRPEDAALWLRLAPLLAERPPPTVPVLGKRLGLAAASLERTLVRLARFGHLVRIARNRVVRRADLAGWEAAVTGTAADGTVGLRAFCDATGLGRNFAVALLEHFDRNGLTRRGADGERLLREPAGDADCQPGAGG